MDPETGSPNAPVVEPGSAQAFDWESDDNPYKQRFTEYRSEADRRATKLSTYEQSLEDLRSGDPERQSAAAVALGIELVQDEPEDPGYIDPVDELIRRQEALEQRLTQAEQTRVEREASLVVETRLDALDLDEADKDWVLARAVALPAGDDGLPNVAAAHEQLRARDTARLEAAMNDWAAGKRTPRGVAPGTTATEQKNVMDMTDEERVEWAVARLDNA
jgi:hypothetical protein